MYKALLFVCLLSVTAFADPTTLTTTGAEPMDGFRLRHGVAFSAGDEIGSGPSSGLSGALYGVDWRIGGQINNDYAVYLDTHLSFGTAHIGATSGYTGNFAVAAMFERTIMNQFFVAAGGGYGVLNNPSGPLGQLRAGWYPLISASDTHARRKGLVVGVDARFYFADAMTIGTVTQLSASIGYEAF
jgi:hypothetical protein